MAGFNSNEKHLTSPVEGNSTSIESEEENPDELDSYTGVEKFSDEWFLQLSQQMYDSSKNYMEANYHLQWEKNLDNFNNVHPSGSKYWSDLYDKRNKMFRPRTRAAVRNAEATAAAAFFSNMDQVNVEPQNPNNPMSMAAAVLMKELIEYRLDESIPWFEVCVGAYQDTHKHGICIGCVEWEYEEEEYEEEWLGENDEPYMDENGNPMVQKGYNALIDRPIIRIIPPENFSFAPSSNWINPIDDSPYVIEHRNMTVGDVILMTESAYIKTEMQWYKPTVEELLATTRDESESVRHSREKDRQDPKEDWNVDIDDFKTVWINYNIARIDGEDWFWITAARDLLLCKPKKLSEVFPHLGRGERPYIMGKSNIESHVPIPAGSIELSQDLQAAANTIQNQRFDNVQLAMNKRYFARRAANIDYRALARGAPGVVVSVDDPEKDVKIEENREVTASAYQEQDRVNQDFDEIWGNFSMPSVASARNLNETVGGMGMMVSAAEKIAEYSIKIFAETFVRPVMKQLAKLLAYYETDEVVLALVANRSSLQEFGVSQVDNRLMSQDLLVKVNVGMGATDPMRRINQMNIAMDTLGKAGQIPFFNLPEIGKEIFGALGYKDGDRFVNYEANPQVQQLQQEIQQLQFDKQAKVAIGQMEIEKERVRQEGFIEAAKMDAQAELTGQQLKTYIDMIDLYLKSEQNDIKRQELQMNANKAIMELNKMMIDKAVTDDRDSRQYQQQIGLLREKGAMDFEREKYKQQNQTANKTTGTGSSGGSKKQTS